MELAKAPCFQGCGRIFSKIHYPKSKTDEALGNGSRQDFRVFLSRSLLRDTSGKVAFKDANDIEVAAS